MKIIQNLTNLWLTVKLITSQVLKFCLISLNFPVICILHLYSMNPDEAVLTNGFSFTQDGHICLKDFFKGEGAEYDSFQKV